MKTTQCLKINVHGVNLVCTFTPGRRNAYQLYRLWLDPGQHGMRQRRRKIDEYANLESVLCRIVEMRCPEFKID